MRSQIDATRARARSCWLRPWSQRATGVFILFTLGGCDRLLHLEQFSSVHAADAGSAACARCDATPRSVDCAQAAGPADDPRAIVIGALFSLGGADATASLAQLQAATLAVDEINAAGGVQLGGAELRPLVMVACDESRDLLRAARHLIETLRVQAILGPSTSQDMLELATQLSIASGTLLISPSAAAASIADLLDDDTSWLMVPSDAQRAPLMAAQLAGLEDVLHAERQRPLRLGLLSRDDVLGRDGRLALSNLNWNGVPLASVQNLSGNVRVDSYDPGGADFAQLVATYRAFAPDLIVMLGTVETVTQLMAPLERAWTAGERPHYLLTDSSRVPELRALLRSDPSLRARVSGSGVRPSAASAPIYDRFLQAYRARFGDTDADSPGAAQAYAATYAIGHAYASARSAAASGKELALGLRALHGGSQAFSVQPDGLRAAERALADGARIELRGPLAPLDWDERGAVRQGELEIWCMTTDGELPSFVGSGLGYDLASGTLQGQFRACGPGATAATDAQAPPASTPAAPSGAAEAPPQPGMNPDQAPAADAPAAAGQPGPPVQQAARSDVAQVDCGDQKCGAGEYCCVASAMPSAAPESAAVSCEHEPRECAHAFHCDGDSDCGPGAQCCERAGTTLCLPASEGCPGVHFACRTARDCAAGQHCCSHLNPARTAYVATRCETSCDAAANSSPLCESAADCPVGLPCRTSHYLANLSVCDY